MKQLSIAFILLCLITSCKKNRDIAPSFTVTSSDGVSHSYIVAGTSMVSYHPPSGVGPIPASYSIDLVLGSDRLKFYIDNLSVSNKVYDNNNMYETRFANVSIDGISYSPESISVNNVITDLSDHAWPGEPDLNAIASGSVDIVFNLPLGKKIAIKGNYSDVFAKK